MSERTPPIVPDLAPFDYVALPSEARIVIQQKTGEIRERVRRAAQDIVEIGERLIIVQEQLPHGAWERWLQAEFAWSDQTARRFMHVARAFGGKQQIVAFAPAALYALAAPSVPDEAREEALARAEQGERITHQVAGAIIVEHKPAPADPPLTRAELAALAEAGWTPTGASGAGLVEFSRAGSSATVLQPPSFYRAILAGRASMAQELAAPAPPAPRTVTTPSATDLPPDMDRRLIAAGFQWLRAAQLSDGSWLHHVNHRTGGAHHTMTAEQLESLLAVTTPAEQAASPPLDVYTVERQIGELLGKAKADPSEAAELLAEAQRLAQSFGSPAYLMMRIDAVRATVAQQRAPVSAAPASRVAALSAQNEAERLPEPAASYALPAPAGATYDQDDFESIEILVDDLHEAMQAGNRGAALRTWLTIGETLLNGSAFSFSSDELPQALLARLRNKADADDDSVIAEFEVALGGAFAKEDVVEGRAAA